MKITEASLEQFRQDPRNANRGSVRGRETLRASLEECGAGRSILVSSDDVVLAGNKTHLEAGETGHESVIVVETDGTQLVAVKRTDLHSSSPEARRLALFDNRSSELSLDWDASAIDEALKDGLDLSVLWTGDELEELLASLEPAGGLLDGADPDAIPEKVDSRVKRGELWQLGRHRLLCGDSTESEDVERLLDGKRVAMVWADPPFGINYTGHGPSKLGPSRKFEAIQGDSAVSADWLAYCLPAPEGAIYLKTAWGVLWQWEEALAHSAEVRSRIVWDKQAHVGGDVVNGYARSSEVVLFGVVGKHQLRQFDTDVWSITRASIGIRQGRTEHPFESPVELPARAIRNSSGAGDLILDPFCGSGSALLAAQMEGRSCYAVEIEPAFCDIVLARWEAATDQSAVRL